MRAHHNKHIGKTRSSNTRGQLISREKEREGRRERETRRERRREMEEERKRLTDLLINCNFYCGKALPNSECLQRIIIVNKDHNRIKIIITERLKIDTNH